MIAIQRPPSEAKRLLRREVVGVDLGQVDRQAAGARGGVDEHQRVLVGALGPDARAPSRRSRSRCAPRRRRRRRPRPPPPAASPGRLAITEGSASHGARPPALANFEENSPNDQVLALLADQPERRDVPERGRAAVAEHDLVALGQREQRRPGPRAPGRRGCGPAPGGGRCPSATRRSRPARRGGRSGSSRARRRSGRRRAAGRRGSSVRWWAASVTPPILAAAHIATTRRSPDDPERRSARDPRGGCGCVLAAGRRRSVGLAGLGDRRVGVWWSTAGASVVGPVLVVFAVALPGRRPRDDGERAGAARSAWPATRRTRERLRELRARPWLTCRDAASRSSASTTATPTRCC